MINFLYFIYLYQKDCWKSLLKEFLILFLNRNFNLTFIVFFSLIHKCIITIDNLQYSNADDIGQSNSIFSLLDINNS